MIHLGCPCLLTVFVQVTDPDVMAAADLSLQNLSRDTNFVDNIFASMEDATAESAAFKYFLRTAVLEHHRSRWNAGAHWFLV